MFCRSAMERLELIGCGTKIEVFSVMLSKKLSKIFESVCAVETSRNVYR
ncbi:hypothetical protein CpsigB_07500 [Corynebacterium pseudotuberculosis]|uniref:Uncharacterized protein n=1 Tax=Corynebacterium pseudotuberculosis (strain C231) TaxID=681645 RepID=D9QAM5_CORP2|nr:hypothetical protein CPC231_05690 [Corynebacterium pseudotuberculosis C231]ADL21011.1 hypothetical protein CP1002_07460 [Corynebacterium pseudotuberculosis 1002]ADO26400.1 hypothetical protein CPI19_05830 [Corynebacterium pseudotuberculosis I19]AFH52077.1 Hypothetical protein Cp267_1178 [Corynebacterium pseudotuberculosis 267]AFH90949.2 hypothetical protein CP31_06065 [Corynebacterium pseudotuberculosis 31]AFM07469.2 hypothetical protein CP162_05445 [Corynebacterium pseudotuberculosis Cp162